MFLGTLIRPLPTIYPDQYCTVLQAILPFLWLSLVLISIPAKGQMAPCFIISYLIALRFFACHLPVTKLIEPRLYFRAVSTSDPKYFRTSPQTSRMAFICTFNSRLRPLPGFRSTSFHGHLGLWLATLLRRLPVDI